MFGSHFLAKGRFFYPDSMMEVFSNPYFWVPRAIGLAILIIGIVFIVKALKKRKSFFIEYNSEAIEILKLKFINGEVDELEYKRKLDILR